MDHQEPSPELGLLATELVLHIAEYSDVPTLAALASVNRRFHAIAKPVLYMADAQNMSMALIWGAKHNILDIIKYSLSMGGDVNTDSRLDVSPARMGSGRRLQSFRYGVHQGMGTPLHFAALKGNDAIVRCLLENGANVIAESWYVCGCVNITRVHPLWIPLHHAICGGHLSTVQILMSHRRMHQLDRVHEVLAIESAAASGRSDILRHLFEDATADEMDAMRRLGNNYIWQYATQCFDLNRVDQCLPLLREYFPFDDEGFRPGGQRHLCLAHACQRGHFATARFLLHEIAPIQHDSFLVESPFYAATRDPLWYRMSVPEDLWTSAPWYKRWNDDRLAVIRTLVEHGADILVDDMNAGCAPIHGAAEAGDYELVEILAEAGADLNVSGRDGRTPLMLATIRDSLPTVMILLEHGASTHPVDNQGHTVADYAVRYRGNDFASWSQT